MINYATADNGKFPPYNTIANRFWYQPDKLGKFLPSIVWNEVRGPAVTCPEDPDANRSYSMNIWVSGDALLSPKLAAAGRLWRPRDKNSSKMILVAEKWSTIYNPVSKPLWGTDGMIGFNLYTPGQRFGGGTGENFPTNRFGTASSELPYQRHRKPSGPGMGLQSIGAVNIGYVDGHVALKYNGDLYDMNTGKSTLNSLWSPADYDLNN